MWLHGAANFAILLGATGIALLAHRPAAERRSSAVGLGACALATYTAYLGGEMVYAHGVGVRTMPWIAPTGVRRSPSVLSAAAPAAFLRDAVKGLRLAAPAHRSRLLGAPARQPWRVRDRAHRSTRRPRDRSAIRRDGRVAAESRSGRLADPPTRVRASASLPATARRVARALELLVAPDRVEHGDDLQGQERAGHEAPQHRRRHALHDLRARALRPTAAAAAPRPSSLMVMSLGRSRCTVPSACAATMSARRADQALAHAGGGTRRRCRRPSPRRSASPARPPTAGPPRPARTAGSRGGTASRSCRPARTAPTTSTISASVRLRNCKNSSPSISSATSGHDDLQPALAGGQQLVWPGPLDALAGRQAERAGSPARRSTSRRARAT